LKKQSSGNKVKRPKKIILFLDENLDTDDVADALTQAGIKYKRHREISRSGTPDAEWLPIVGQKHWVLITADQKIRYRGLERAAVRQHKIREFAFSSGNLGVQVISEVLVKAYRAMCRFCAMNAPPFIATLSRSGQISLKESATSL
jgi:predicted nuclease of predicted toxin-antitoxin system